MVLSASLLEILLGNLPFLNYWGVGNILKNISWEYFENMNWEFFVGNILKILVGNILKM